MSIFKRLYVTMSSRIDQVVGEIENHDAVVQATVTEMRKKVAAAKVRLGNVRREQKRLQEQITTELANAERWRRRAVESASSNEAKALECVSRARHCEQMVGRLREAEQQYAQAAEKLAGDILAAEQRMTDVKQKLALMRARESTSSALAATSQSGEHASQLLEDTFDRWEINISQAEMAVDRHDVVDVIEHEFIQKEQDEELRAELAAMLAKEK